MTYELILTRTEGDKVGVITLNRPKQLNALNDQLMTELGQALQAQLQFQVRLEEVEGDGFIAHGQTPCLD